MRRVAPAVASSTLTLTTLALTALLVALLAGCTKPTVTTGLPSPGPGPTTGTPRTGDPIRQPTLSPPRTGTATPTFGEQEAVSCAGYPSAEQVITFLRRTSGMLPANVTVNVRTGPLCAGTWQYTVLAVPNQDPLQVITRGLPTSLQLVTAGTDVCSVSVRATAPAGIRTVTKCT